ncbi:mitochondrial ribosome-associated GTPase 2-like [Biomphalaria glabrata]|uniref:Mitochondrial ribosome-associated GTPase 2-like n=2 Tax=Biomphalaria glabrata TaxID=6526 RepID=A0A9W3B0A7_BIOGL|nr:mitochondrial ribosome-associated GTPase 2-like [Biomphalaria glabrata]XP_055892906.1 mitochondrial ribosome-associated GTPase 2-like [Biomphalaria glabrata]XP_055892907.1 mitochondrial ribosome-associated GTPase 2-like [Biomphalaria glabrata]XP_055892908.1 mitochondrial ribosome-associated GTPase 2-like [Biomphalaria glabrata]XP_055892909.1 mitochondrial ribosome-associated GTPase 2-like [Biomphalaria glabrata]XP_055892910.1 mitochondrial ribosome-associated GTPase 2-like [Biomphalaria gla
MLSYSIRKVLITNWRSANLGQDVFHFGRSLICSRCYSLVAKHLLPKKGKGIEDKKSHHFVDYLEVEVQGGKGGDGMLSFQSLPKKEWAGPDGGNGGHGGHVIFKASHNKKSLNHLSNKEMALNGRKGLSKQRDGKNAEHRYIDVPLGTVIKAKDGQLLASLDNDEEFFIAARGGAGGKGNYFFLSNENRAPAIAELGAQGQCRNLYLELKTMAYAGLIGFPNAGKSTLLRAISRAQPKVSAYPFTTLNPHIGMVQYQDHEQIAVADIPGLIPGAHQNRGLGISFLRHIERCLCLIYVIDLSIEEPLEQLNWLRFELNQYQPGLADRPNLLIGNKIDVIGAAEKLEYLKQEMNKIRSEEGSHSLTKTMPVLGLSAKKFIGIEEFIENLRLMYDTYNEENTLQCK